MIKINYVYITGINLKSSLYYYKIYGINSCIVNGPKEYFGIKNVYKDLMFYNHGHYKKTSFSMKALSFIYKEIEYAKTKPNI